MTGSLQVKNGKFYVVLNIYEKGKRKPKWIATGLTEKGNKRQAQKMLNDILHEYEHNKHDMAVCDYLFSDCVRQWMEQIKRRVDAVTYQGYEALALRHILPYFDETGIKLQEITHTHLQAYIDEKAAQGRKDGKGGLSARSLRLHKNILNQTLNEAVKAGWLPSNPCQFVVVPAIARFEASFYTPAQLQKLFSVLRDDPMLPMVRITAIYGLRRSELLGIKWDSIDFERGTLTIKHTVSKVTKAVEKDKTKNASSYRSFPLLPEARQVFEQAKAAKEINRRLFGKEYQQNEYVFTWPNGCPFSPDYVSKHFAAVLKKNNLPHIRFHELRHSCASLLINQGFTLKDVQEWMGHSDIKMTANIYGHLDVERKQDMAEKLSNVLCG